MGNELLLQKVYELLGKSKRTIARYIKKRIGSFKNKLI